MKKSPLYQVDMNCPVCKVTFKTSKVKTSRCILKSRDADFCVYYRDENPIFYHPVVCPQCGYAAMIEEFDKVSSSEAGKIFANVGRKWKQKDLGGARSIEEAIDAYKLALYCSRLKDSTSFLSTASVCMRLAWMNRYRDNAEEERHFLSHALKNYKLAFENENMKGHMDEMTLIYLIGELNRRLGDYREAVSWFSRAVSHNMRFQKPVIEKMAREQWQLCREHAEEGKKDERENSV